jgi:putative phosphoesterase
MIGLMLLAVLSDIHDHLHNLAAAIEYASAAEVLICCGDLCSPFVMDQLARFPGPVHIVFGNNDADLFRITRKSSDRVRVHGEFFETVLDGKKVAVNHFDYIARPIAESGRYDIVCYGHNHEFSVARVGRALAINPGPIMGARFPGGKWEDVAATFVMLDTQADSVAAFAIAAGTRAVEPHQFAVSNGWPK